MNLRPILSIKINDSKYGALFFLTWGNIFESSQELIDAVIRSKDHFPVNDLLSIQIDDSLQEAASAPFFYETLWYFSQEKIPQKNNERWKEKMKEKVQEGDWIFFLGIPQKKQEHERNITTWFPHNFKDK